MRRPALALLVGSSIVALPVVAYAANLSGAIFTTTADGSVVNENTHYEAKTDVYLDGGPGPNAPASAAGLPEGDYYYQVTDPSGQDLLSSDHISCRKVHVNGDGVIDGVYSGTNYSKVQGTWTGSTCTHASGTDVDHGGKTVQLYPYDDTPNPGGVYKVWLTPTSAYLGSTAGCSGKGGCTVNGESYSPGNYHGFKPADSKTDNYKVKYKGKPYTAPLITVSKFHDANMDGSQGLDEATVTGWAVDSTDPLGVTNTVYTSATVVADTAGSYALTESTPAGTQQTAAYVDGASMGATPTVSVTVVGTSGETHAVVYGNVGLGSVDACKVFDRNGNGVQDADEGFVPGWLFTLSGTAVTGTAVGPVDAYADDSGCALFDDLAPGAYTVTEGTALDTGWSATGATSATGDIVSTLSGATMAGSELVVDYTNTYWSVADFGTKGYWHNINGLSELTLDDIAEANALDPYRTPSAYFDGGDEPFDGYFSDGTPVPAAEGAIGNLGGEGTPWAEVSDFLNENNGGGTHEEQLAQQLLAFIFNTQHRLDDPGAYLERSDGSLVSASDLIEQAIYAWNYGSDAEVVAMQELLESFNSSDAVYYVPMSAPATSF